MTYFARERYGDSMYHRSIGDRMTPAVKGLIIANVAVFLLQSLLARSAGGRFLVDWFGLVPRLAIGRGCLWQMVTYAFLHGNVIHILFNMLFLYWFGCDVEAVFGTRRFLWFYFGAAVAGAVCFAGVFAATGRWDTPAIGASGAVMGVMVIAAIYWPNRIILAFFFFPMKLRTFVLLALGIDLYNEITHGATGVAGLAHLGGAAYGYLYLRLEPWWRSFSAALANRRAERGFHQSLRDEEELDRILDKVHAEGMHKLNADEKRFLKRMSKRKRG